MTRAALPVRVLPVPAARSTAAHCWGPGSDASASASLSRSAPVSTAATSSGAPWANTFDARSTLRAETRTAFAARQKALAGTRSGDPSAPGRQGPDRGKSAAAAPR